MPGASVQFDLFGGPAEPYVHAGTPAAEAEPEPEPSPESMPEGQLTFIGGRVMRLAPVAALLGEARFEAALEVVAALRGEERLAAALGELVRVVRSAATVDALARLDLGDALSLLTWPGNAALVAAARTGRLVAVARRLDDDGPDAHANGQLAAHYWLSAQLPAQALASLERALAARPTSGEALVALGNLHHAAKDVPRARDCYRQAMRAAPDEVRLADIADVEIQALAVAMPDVTPEPVNGWLPFVGFLLGVFGPSPEVYERAPTAVDCFASALQRSRLATSRGRPDIAARRELKQLAPALFTRLFEAGLV